MLFRSDLYQILDIELDELQQRIFFTNNERQFVFRCSADTKDFLLREGTDVRYGARHLKRAIERHLVFPMSNLIATGQVRLGDRVKVGLDAEAGKLTFAREAAASAGADGGTVVEFSRQRAVPSPPKHADSAPSLRLGGSAGF